MLVTDNCFADFFATFDILVDVLADRVVVLEDDCFRDFAVELPPVDFVEVDFLVDGGAERVKVLESEFGEFLCEKDLPCHATQRKCKRILHVNVQW